MKDSSFKSNEKLFEEVEKIRKVIREEIHDRCRNYVYEGPSAKSSDSEPTSRNKTLHRTSR